MGRGTGNQGGGTDRREKTGQRARRVGGQVRMAANEGRQQGDREGILKSAPRSVWEVRGMGERDTARRVKHRP